MVDDVEDLSNRSLQDAPASGGAEEEEQLRKACRSNREAMTPKETADCSGTDLSDLYDSEEDGGS